MATEDTVNAVLRHVGTSAATGATVFVALGFLTPDQSATIVNATHDVVEGLQQALGGFNKIALILGPLFGTWMAVAAARSATIKGKIASLLRISSSDTVAGDVAKKQLVAAAASLPEVSNSDLAKAVATPELKTAALSPQVFVK